MKRFKQKNLTQTVLLLGFVASGQNSCFSNGTTQPIELIDPKSAVEVLKIPQKNSDEEPIYSVPQKTYGIMDANAKMIQYTSEAIDSKFERKNRSDRNGVFIAIKYINALAKASQALKQAIDTYYTDIQKTEDLAKAAQTYKATIAQLLKKELESIEATKATIKEQMDRYKALPKASKDSKEKNPYLKSMQTSYKATNQASNAAILAMESSLYMSHDWLMVQINALLNDFFNHACKGYIMGTEHTGTNSNIFDATKKAMLSITTVACDIVKMTNMPTSYEHKISAILEATRNLSYTVHKKEKGKRKKSDLDKIDSVKHAINKAHDFFRYYHPSCERHRARVLDTVSAAINEAQSSHDCIEANKKASLKDPMGNKGQIQQASDRANKAHKANKTHCTTIQNILDKMDHKPITDIQRRLIDANAELYEQLAPCIQTSEKLLEQAEHDPRLPYMVRCLHLMESILKRMEAFREQARIDWKTHEAFVEETEQEMDKLKLEEECCNTSDDGVMNAGGIMRDVCERVFKYYKTSFEYHDYILYRYGTFNSNILSDPTLNPLKETYNKYFVCIQSTYNTAKELYAKITDDKHTNEEIGLMYNRFKSDWDTAKHTMQTNIKDQLMVGNYIAEKKKTMYYIDQSIGYFNLYQISIKAGKSMGKTQGSTLNFPQKRVTKLGNLFELSKAYIHTVNTLVHYVYVKYPDINRTSENPESGSVKDKIDNIELLNLLQLMQTLCKEVNQYMDLEKLGNNDTKAMLDFLTTQGLQQETDSKQGGETTIDKIFTILKRIENRK